jgi:hypothetical protein
MGKFKKYNIILFDLRICKKVKKKAKCVPKESEEVEGIYLNPLQPDL